MYKLTLTKNEREAFDWVGDRYTTGYGIYKILIHCMGPNDEWSQEGDIEFSVSESRAHDMHDRAAQEDFLWPCFSVDLKDKMQSFVDVIK